MPGFHIGRQTSTATQAYGTNNNIRHGRPVHITSYIQ